MLNDLLGQALAGLSIETGQRNQSSHPSLGRDLAFADRLLNRQGKILDQAQTP